jgi:RimJ/RimL family protein N-acetyltransferase
MTICLTACRAGVAFLSESLAIHAARKMALTLRDGSATAPDTASPVGRFHTWWRGDALPTLPAVPGLAIAPGDDQRLLSELTTTAPRTIASWIEKGHRPWLARMRDEPVAWGWVATDELSIGELRVTRQLPPGNRYLWGFFTSPAWRGRGIYPRLLQAIIKNEPEAERFWVGHDLDNIASARGIATAGFLEIGPLFRLENGGYELVPTCPPPRAVAAAELFGVRIADQPQEERVAERRPASLHSSIQVVRQD